MGLLGKTLKGRSTKPGAQGPARNIRERLIQRTPEEHEQEKENQKIKREHLRNQIFQEKKIYNINKKKLLTNWRKIMRMTKTDQLKTDLEIYAQNNHRELDSKEAFLQMLDKNLDEAEDQYNLALRNHLIQIDKLQEIRDARISALNNEFAKAAEILYDEFSREADELMRNHNRQTKEMNDMMETVQDEEADKTMQAREIFQTFREETKDKALEEMENMQNEMNSKQVNLSNYLETLYQKYMNDTKDKFEKYTQLMTGNEQQSKKIDEDMKKIARTKEKIHVNTLKILMMEKEFNTRNEC